MFTGLVEELGQVNSLVKGANSARLIIQANEVMAGTKLGDSIAVNGVCLTVTEMKSRAFVADVMAETLAKTNLGLLQSGEKVNLERAMTLGGRLGGHLVSGHIDGVGTILSQEKVDIAVITKVAAPVSVLRYIIRKGSVALDGISLTVVDLSEEFFTVSLIPHTAKLTTLGYKRPGDKINLEGDLIGKYIERLMSLPMAGNEKKPSGISAQWLAEKGFL